MSHVSHILERKQGDVATIHEEATILEAATKMNQRKIGALVVMEEDRILGIVTERDILCRVVASRKDPATTHVRDIMTTKVAVCSPDTTLESCRSAMTSNKLRHLPVVDGKRLVGMVSIGDLMAFERAEQEQTIRWLHEYMHGPN